MSKKILIPVIVLLLSLTSCTETIVERYSTDNWKIIDVPVSAASWNCYADQYGKPYYEADVYVPEITNYVFTDGFVLGYCVDGDTQMPLPYVRHHQNEAGESWTTTVDFEYNVGAVHIFYTNNDFNYPVGEPGAMLFRFVLQW